MRSEREMFDLILSVARRDDRVRAVLLNGSRANPAAPRDLFQDYDIVYVVTQIAPFLEQPQWIDCFGELMILQLPDDMTPDDGAGEATGENPAAAVGAGRHDRSYAYLMQFADGTRIDLTLFALDRLAELNHDSQTVLLLDKDGVMPVFPPADDRDYLPVPPTAKQFADCCNEFWWVSLYVAKGLWRREMLYALETRERYVRPQLMKALVWLVGTRTDCGANPGKSGKYLERLLPPDTWQALLRTWSDADYARAWDALDAMTALFRATATAVAAHCGFAYPNADDRRVTAHLQRVRQLPGDARSF